MNTQHSPGPWSVNNHLYIKAPNGYTVAQVKLPSGRVGIMGDTYRHNARLIAAAPDLLETLKGCLPKNVCLTNRNVRDDVIVPIDVTMGELRQIAAVVAKATGASNG